MKVAPLLFVLLVGCSSGSGSTSLDGGPSSSSKCDAQADEIRKAAVMRGLADTDVCSDTTPAIQRDFASACSSLAACKADGG